MYNPEERKYIKAAINLVELSKKQQNFSDGRIEAIIDYLKEADKIIKNAKIIRE